jgi:type I restriction enzyme S subunit
LVQTDDLLVGMDGDFNCARWRGPEALLNQRVCKIVPDPEELDLDFLTYVLPGYLKAIHDVTSSTTVTHLSSRDVAEIPIPVPPLREQHELVGLLTAADSRQQSSAGHLQAARRAIERFRHAVLTAACSGRLTANWRSQNSELARQAVAGRQREAIQPLAEIPSEWVWNRLEDVADIRGGIQKGARLKSGEPSREVAYLRVANVQRGWLDLSEVKTIPASERKIAELRLEPGDILFNEGGDRDKLGRGWIWEGQIEECIHQNHVFRARLLDKRMEPRFFSWYGNTIGARYFNSEAKQTVNLASLSMAKLRELPVPVPSIEEQAELAWRVDALLAVADQLLARIEAADQRVRRVSHSVLARALRGELIPEAARVR